MLLHHSSARAFESGPELADVPASEPHPPNTHYRVSKGVEHWGDGEQRYVYKIQMVYDGVVARRKSPSYPEDADDFENVLEAMKTIRKGGGQRSRGTMRVVGEEPGMRLHEAHQMLNLQDDLKD